MLLWSSKQHLFIYRHIHTCLLIFAGIIQEMMSDGMFRVLQRREGVPVWNMIRENAV